MGFWVIMMLILFVINMYYHEQKNLKIKQLENNIEENKDILTFEEFVFFRKVISVQQANGTCIDIKLINEELFEITIDDIMVIDIIIPLNTPRYELIDYIEVMLPFSIIEVIAISIDELKRINLNNYEV